MLQGCSHIFRTIFLYPYIIKACCPTNGKGIVLGKYPSCVSYKNLFYKSKIFLDAFKKGSVPKSCRDCCNVIDNYDWSSVEDVKIDTFYISNWFDCNANCIYCVNNCITDKKITNEVHKSPCYDVLPLLKYLKNENLMGEKLKVFITGGEPTLLAEIPKVIDFFKENDVDFFSVFSSGITYFEIFHKLLQSNIRTELIISPDCGNPDLYRKIKRVDHFYDVFENIKKYGENCSSKNKIIVKYIFIKNVNDNKQSVLEFLDKFEEYAFSKQYYVRFDVDFNYKNVEKSPILDLMKFVDEEVRKRNLNRSYSFAIEHLLKNL